MLNRVQLDINCEAARNVFMVHLTAILQDHNLEQSSYLAFESSGLLCTDITDIALCRLAFHHEFPEMWMCVEPSVGYRVL